MSVCGVCTPYSVVSNICVCYQYSYALFVLECVEFVARCLRIVITYSV